MDTGCVWFVVHKFGQNKWWMSRAEESMDVKQVVLNKPFHFRPLHQVLSCIHEEIMPHVVGDGTEDVDIDM
eukprot:5709582-Karenia_brevis.AAC.1